MSRPKGYSAIQSRSNLGNIQEIIVQGWNNQHRIQIEGIRDRECEPSPITEEGIRDKLPLIHRREQGVVTVNNNDLGSGGGGAVDVRKRDNIHGNGII
ncbi:unnamed protein product [Prunus armeniaca]